MTRIGVAEWLRRRDPGYRVLRRGVRLALVAAAGLFGGRYALDNPLLGLYTLFTAIATGFISQVPGGPIQRARTLLAALPVAWALVTVGTLLAVDIWVATAGMLVVGFVIPFSAVAGPRILGLATGLQLFYIAASFPPYQPDTLPSRLGGVTLGVGLLIIAELLLWPDPTPPTYRQRLGGAAGSVARYLDLLAGLPGGGPVDRAELARRRAEAAKAMDGVWLARLPPTQRPASAGRRDRALRHGDRLLRQVLDHVHRLGDRLGEVRDDELAGLLRQAAGIVHDAGRTLRGAAEPVETTRLTELEGRIRDLYDRPPGFPRPESGPARLRIEAVSLRAADHAHAFGVVARIVAGLPPPARSPGGPGLDEFWYAHHSPVLLYWHQFRFHLTTRSVYFQGAVRVSLALGAARVIAGFLHLNHGFWVLLAILTLLRTSAVDTRSALRPVLLGTLLGAAVGSLLLFGAGEVPTVLLVALPVAMVLTFATGPLLPQLWGQALFTVLFVMVFAQAGPPSLQIAGVRLLDVTIGAVVGVLAGLLLWPKGGGGELRRSIARYLSVSAAAAEEVTRTMAGRPSRQDAVGAARQAWTLAEASFLQYQMERDDPRLPPVNWQAALAAGQHLHLGAVSRLRRGAHARLTRVEDAAGPLDDLAGRVRRRYTDLAQQLSAGRLDRRVAPPRPPEDFGDRVRGVLAAGESRAAALNLVDVEVWLSGAAADLDRIQPKQPEPSAACG
ncbi:FUSC family protein [Plantactinospora endophytica]|uniref:Fusaric acid resistance protein n=1 Tax=Plantactinospora endophytica TaxID=673535 RepID=A0ABQ4E2F4_9ACTN|nr:FUSC family protein [Plantactinospora endophytica]GIG88845.1 fusaric acid resistance protein [Plantactinospora endophytica]